MTIKHCRRSNGTLRAWFHTREEAEAFEKTHEGYHGDLAHLCGWCGFWHLARPEWLQLAEYRATVVSEIIFLFCKRCREPLRNSEEIPICTGCRVRAL
jgi:hypothetical protein